MKSKQIISICLSFIILFAISCGEAAYAPEEGSDIVSSVPTATGSVITAADLSSYNNFIYRGTITLDESATKYGGELTKEQVESRKSRNSYIKIKGASIEFGETYDTGDSKTEVGEWKKASDGSFQASSKTTDDSSYIKITLNNNTANVEYINGATVSGEAGNYYYLLKYTGTLNKE